MKAHTSHTGENAPTNGLDFGDALNALKIGKRVGRAGWNGKGMWLALSSPISPEHQRAGLGLNPSGIYSFINGLDAPVPTLPFIVMKTATNELVPWLASQTDMLAEDWTVVG